MVAIWVLLVPLDAVGAVGVPVKLGEARGAFSVSSSLSAAWTLVDEMFPAATLVI